MESIRSLLFVIIISVILSPQFSLLAQVEKVELAVSGMTCNLCAYGVEKNLKRQKGVESLVSKLEEQLIIVTAKRGESLDIRKLVKAVRDSELDVRELKVAVSGRLVDWEGNLALQEDVNEIFLLKGLKGLEEAKGKEVKLIGRVYALQGKAPPRFVMESLEVISTK